jgi:UDPglucose 6-dehydrogenase
LRATIVGAGRVGLTTALALEHLGHEVTSVDNSAFVVDSLCRKATPFHDPALDGLLASSQMTVLSGLTAQAASADVVMICVPTPGLEDGHANLSYVHAVAREVAELAEDGADVVLAIKSTTPPGTADGVRELVGGVLRQRRASATVRIASNPEFLRQGSALADTLYPDRIVVGVEDEVASGRMYELYEPIIDQSFEAPASAPRSTDNAPLWIGTTPVNAELIKYGSNAFLATKLTFVNELARLAHSLGGDISDVTYGVGLDPRIGSQYMQAGPGFGGPCLGKDTKALAAVGDDVGEETPLIDAVSVSNEIQRMRIVDRLEEALGSVRGAKVGLLGLSFKAGTDDVTDSPALGVAAALVERGADVRAFDPAAEERAQITHPDLLIAYHDHFDEMTDGCDALVLMTDWPEFRHIDWSNVARLAKGRLVVDSRNFLDREQVEAAGFTYVGLGRLAPRYSVQV